MFSKLAFLTMAAVLLASCSVQNGETISDESAVLTSQTPVMADEGPNELVVMTHDSFAISEAVLAEFEKENNAKIVLLPAGDTGAALNQAILAKNDPLADVFFGVDNTFMGRALGAGIFEMYESPLLSEIPAGLKMDSSHRLTPVDFGDVCLNYDKTWFAEEGLRPPSKLEDLVDPDYRSLTVVENPATSSPGLAFLLATVAEFGSEGGYSYLDYWRDLKANDVFVTDGWENAYFGHFSAASDGDRPIVVSYASSPPAEMVFADPPLEEPPTASITSPGTCFRQVEFAGILTGTGNRQLAERFIDFMLTVQFQEDVPMNMFVFPANQNAKLPDVFNQWAQVPSEPAEIDPAEIEENRDRWIEEWTNVVLR